MEHSAHYHACSPVLTSVCVGACRFFILAPTAGDAYWDTEVRCGLSWPVPGLADITHSQPVPPHSCAAATSVSKPWAPPLPASAYFSLPTWPVQVQGLPSDHGAACPAGAGGLPHGLFHHRVRFWDRGARARLSRSPLGALCGASVASPKLCTAALAAVISLCWKLSSGGASGVQPSWLLTHVPRLCCRPSEASFFLSFLGWHQV
jgi:hypothetical protein